MLEHPCVPVFHTRVKTGVCMCMSEFPPYQKILKTLSLIFPGLENAWNLLQKWEKA